jgi:hypothetical protein
MNALNYNMGQKIKTDAKGIVADLGFIARLQISGANAVATSNNSILAATPLTTTAQTITAGITNPGTPRNIRIIGNAAMTGSVTIKGTNYNGDSITETLTLNGTTAVDGAKAFATVIEIDLPVQSAAGNTVSVGFGEKLGLPYKLQHNTVRDCYLNNVKEASAATVTTSATALENNTIDLVSALNGSVVDIYLIV